MKVVGYKARQQKLNRMLSEEGTKRMSRLNGKRTFIRNRKMPLVELLVCTLSKRGLTTEMELRRYAAERGEQAVRVTKQGYLQQRKRLNPNVFRYLNEEYLKEFYQSRSAIYVYQDFGAQMLAYNILQDIRHVTNKNMSRRGEDANRRYTLRTNENLALGLFKEHMIGILLERSDAQRTRKLKLLQLEIERYTMPRRTLPGPSRKKRLSNKYSNNQKPSF